MFSSIWDFIRHEIDKFNFDRQHWFLWYFLELPLYRLFAVGRYFPSRTFWTFMAIYLLVQNGYEKSLINFDPKQITQFVSSLLPIYSTITIGFFGALFSAYAWNIANGKGIKFSAIYNGTRYKSVIWWRIWYFVLIYLLFSGMFDISNATSMVPFLHINPTIFSLSIALFIVCDILWFFYDVFDVLQSLDNPRPELLLLQYIRSLKGYYLGEHERYRKKKFLFVSNLDREAMSEDQWWVPSLAYYDSELINFVNSITRHGNTLANDHVEDLKSVLNGLERRFDWYYEYYWKYWCESAEEFKVVNKLIYCNIIWLVCDNLLWKSPKIAIEIFRENLSAFTNVLYSDEYENTTKEDLLSLLSWNYELWKIVLLNIGKFSGNMFYYNKDNISIPYGIGELLLRHAEKLISDNGIPFNTLRRLFFNLWVSYSTINFDIMVQIFGKLFDVLNSEKGTKEKVFSLYDLVLVIDTLDDDEYRISYFFTKVLSPLFQWTFNKERLQFTNESSWKLARDFFGILGSSNNLSFHKPFCLNAFSNFGTHLMIVDKNNADLIISEIIQACESAFPPRLWNKDRIVGFYHEIGTHLKDNWFRFPDTSFLDDIVL